MVLLEGEDERAAVLRPQPVHRPRVDGPGEVVVNFLSRVFGGRHLMYTQPGGRAGGC